MSEQQKQKVKITTKICVRDERRTRIHGVGGLDTTAALNNHCIRLQSSTYLNVNRQVVRHGV